MNITVKKFGGTSVGSIERIFTVAERIVKDKARGELPVVVVSAMSGETDRLVRLARGLAPFSKGSAYDMLLAAGEQISVALLALALEKYKLKVVPLLAHQVGIYTDSLFSKARIQKINTGPILKCLKEGYVPLIAGFQGVTKHNKITTLGRGGSDTTAVGVAVALQQNTCEIFTDVSKVYTADPRLIKSCKIAKLSFEEMMEMSSLGSRVLHHRAVEMAAKYNVRLHVRSSYETTEGTWIVPKEELMETPLVSAVTHDLQTVLIKMVSVPKGVQFISQLFDKLAQKAISVDVISQSDQEKSQRLAFSISSEDLKETTDILHKVIDKKNVFVKEDVAKVSIVGVGMAHHPGVASRFFKVLNQKGLHLHLVTTSEIKVSAIIDRAYLKQVVQALHTEFQLKGSSTDDSDVKSENKSATPSSASSADEPSSSGGVPRAF